VPLFRPFVEAIEIFGKISRDWRCDSSWEARFLLSGDRMKIRRLYVASESNSLKTGSDFAKEFISFRE